MATDVARRTRSVVFYAVAGVATLLTALLTVGATGSLFAGNLSDDGFIAAVAHIPWLALCYCAAFATMLRRPARRPAAYQQALATAVSMYVGALVAGENDPILFIGFGVVLVTLGLTHPARSALFRPGHGGISPVLVPMALVAAAPLALYSARITAELPDTTGPDGVFYTGIAALALTIPFVAFVAGVRAPGSRLPLWSAGISLVVLCGASLVATEAASAMPAWAAVTGVVGGALFVAAGEWEQRRAQRTRSSGPSTASAQPSRSGTADRA
ncbi:MAG TPA: hypothetical protein VFD41_00615 [Actinomycetales bacterium]|nr:hypothetical protein [Actinomycetales bacterium]